MRRTLAEDRLCQLVDPVIRDQGLRLVDLSLGVLGRDGFTLQILVENPQTLNATLDECTRASRSVSAVLDVEDPIAGAYRLEVSSPGIDRPLTRGEDFDTYQGREARIEIELAPDAPAGTQKRFKGIIQGRDDAAQAVLLAAEGGGVVSIPLNAILKAQLVLNDDLIRWSRNYGTATPPADQNHYPPASQQLPSHGERL